MFRSTLTYLRYLRVLLWVLKGEGGEQRWRQHRVSLISDELGSRFLACIPSSSLQSCCHRCFFNPRPLSKVQAPCDLWGASLLWESVDNGMLGTGSYKIRRLGGSAVIHTESLLLVVVSQEVFREIVHSLPILNVTVRSCSSWALFKILRCLGWRLGKLVNILGLPSLACIRLPLSSPIHPDISQ